VPDGQPATGAWRIDELAQRAGLSVDTIRYYAREGLFQAPERSGRHKLYGPEHLERLTRIRELQEQRFSLAAIRAILTADRPGLEGLFAGTAHSYTLAELLERSGLDSELVDRLRAVELLADPAAMGRETYDDDDLAVLRAIAELQEIGMTESILVDLGAIYVRHFRALQADVHAMLAGQDRDWDHDELVAIQRQLISREHAAKHEWNEVFQRHGTNFREKSGCRRDGHEELSCINRAYGVARRVP
jgi:DNA-binding transcriptional MerR regulator